VNILLCNNNNAKKLLAISMIMFMTFLILPVGNTQAEGLPEITVSNIQGNVGTTKDVTVNISNVDKMRGIQFDLEFTGDVSVQSYTVGDFFTIGSASANKLNDTAVRMLWYDGSGGDLSGDGNMLTVTVNLDGPSEGAINITELALQDVTGSNAIATINNGTSNISYTISQIVGLINNASDGSQLVSLIDTHSTELGIEMADFNGLSADGKTSVANDVYNNKPIGGYADASAIASAFNTAVSDQKAAEELEDAIAAVNNAATATQMQAALEDNAPTLDLDTGTGSDYAGLNDKLAVATAMLQGQTYADKAAIITAFNAAVATQKSSEASAAELAEAIEAINSAVDAQAMQTALESKASTLGLVVTSGDYAGLSNKLAAAQEMYDNKPYSDKTAIATAFNIAVANQKAVEEAGAELAEATQKVVAAEDAKSDLSTQSLIDAAQSAYDAAEELVDQLPTSTEKIDLAARLEVVQTAINDAQTLLDAIAAVNNAVTETQMQAALEDNATTLDLDTGTGSDYAGIVNKAAVATAMLQGQTYTDQTAIVSSFEQAVATQKASEASAAELAEAIAAVNNAADQNAMKTALETYEAVLDLDIGGDYAGLNNKLAVASAMLPGKPFADKATIISAFNTAVTDQKAIEEAEAELTEAVAEVEEAEALIGDLSTQSLIDAAQTAHNTAEALVDQLPTGTEKDDLIDRLSEVQTAIDDALTLLDAIEAVNEATSTETMKAVLEANAAVLGLATGTGSDYYGLEDKLAVAAAMLEGQTYANEAAIVSAFEQAVINQKAEEVSVTLSGTVTISDDLDFSSSASDETVDVELIIDGVEYTKQLTFTGGEGTASFSDTFGTTISSGDTLLVKISGYLSQIFVFEENVDDKGIKNDINVLIMPGDLSDDENNTIDSADLAEFANAFNTTSSDNDFTELADLNKDGEINVKDLYYLGKYYDLAR